MNSQPHWQEVSTPRSCTGVTHSYFNEIGREMLYAFSFCGISQERPDCEFFWLMIFFLLKHTQFMKIHCSPEIMSNPFEFKCL
jgi:hypothetical protein